MTVCLLCRSTRLAPVLTELRDNRFGSPGAWTILGCDDCGLRQTDPLPTPDQLRDLYERHYNAGAAEEGTSPWARLRAKLLASPLYWLFLFLDGDVSFHTRRGSGRLLDVGCNEGRGLALYRANGFEPEGLELNRVAAAAARAKGFTVHEVDVAALTPERRFRVVVLSNVLEHALDPIAMLRAVRGLLEPGGEVWISLPNAESALGQRWGRDWINWHVPFHITHFSAPRLSRLLTETGFGPFAWRNVTPALWVAQSAIAHRFPGEPHRQRAPLPVIWRMAVARLLLFPLLSWWNATGRGDCLVVRARRG